MANETDNMFSSEELKTIRERFYYVDTDRTGARRLFFDNAGGSLRLKAAEKAFHDTDSLPDCPEHTNRISLEIDAMEKAVRRDIMSTIFNAKSGALYVSYTASQIVFEVMRVIGEHAKGTNYVTTPLEHPSAFDATRKTAERHGCELRVAKANRETGGVDAEAVISLIDKDTAVLCCMSASNISGYIYDIETIFKRAREINPDIFIFCDAVQHAPHGALDPEKYGVDAMNIAPYKFFGTRGFAVCYLSDRVAALDHHALIGKDPKVWDVGTPGTPSFAAVGAVIDYVVSLGKMTEENETNRRKLFEIGMKRIHEHERGLLRTLLEGTANVPGLRHIDGVYVAMDGKDLTTRDLILGVGFRNMPCEQAARELEKRGIVAYERSEKSMYSKRMLDAFDEKVGVVRVSPLHVNTVEEMEEFLKVVQEIAKL